jgi:hypothetical protein
MGAVDFGSIDKGLINGVPTVWKLPLAPQDRLPGWQPRFWATLTANAGWPSSLNH